MQNPQSQHDWKKYLIVFLITIGIFLVAIYLSSAISNKRFAELRMFQDKLAGDILSSETRFALLEQTSCKHFVDDKILTEELSVFGNRLATMERQSDVDESNVAQLKEYYALLQVKDYLLVSRLAEKCGTNPVIMFYFYKKDCPECDREGYILTDVQKDYPGLNLYSFDYDMESSAVRTLISILDVPKDKLPVLIINDVVYENGLEEKELRDALDALFPEQVAAKKKAANETITIEE